jgi:hypothetical protein
MLFQSHSSSSTTSIGNEVRTSCPISDLFTMMVTVSSGTMRMKALGAKVSPGVACARERRAPGAR